MGILDDFVNVGIKSAEVLVVYGVILAARQAVKAGTATKSQAELISAFDSVLNEAKTRLELEAMQREAKALSDKQAEFQEKWRHLLPEGE